MDDYVEFEKICLNGTYTGRKYLGKVSTLECVEISLCRLYQVWGEDIQRLTILEIQKCGMVLIYLINYVDCKCKT